MSSPANSPDVRGLEVDDLDLDQLDLEQLGPAGFRWRVTSDRWWWSPETFRLHGYRPGEVRPSTARFLNHLHPDDRLGFVEAVHRGVSAGGVVLTEHRAVDIRGRIRPVLLIARSTSDPRGEVDTLEGVLLPIEEHTHHPSRSWWPSAISAVTSVSRRAAVTMVGWHRTFTDDTAETLQLLAELTLLADDEAGVRDCFEHLFLRPALVATEVAAVTGARP
jgi:hypothetical protein